MYKSIDGVHTTSTIILLKIQSVHCANGKETRVFKVARGVVIPGCVPNTSTAKVHILIFLLPNGDKTNYLVSAIHITTD